VTSPPRRTAPPAAPPPAERPARKRRLTFNERGELAALPERIDALEREREELYARLVDPAVLRDGKAAAAARARIEAIEPQIRELTDRWEELETVAAESGG
jgi:ATP-binding cassette subfamily F protein uup